MPTPRNVTVKTSGGDYTTLSAAEAGEQADLVTLDRLLTITVFALNDTTPFIIDGWTTDATRYIIIAADSTARHAGYWDTSKYYMSATPATSTALIRILEKYVVLSGLQLQLTMTNSESSTSCISVGDLTAAGNIIIINCLFKGIISGSNGNAQAVNASDPSNGLCLVQCINCVAFDFYDSSFINSNVAIGFANGFGDLRLYNCTTYNCNTGYSAVSSSFKASAVNCLSYNFAVNSNYLDFTTNFQNSGFNASTDTTAPGVSTLVSQTSGNIAFKSTTSTNADFLDIGPTSTLVGTGFNDPLSGFFNYDIRLRTRTVTWDIGANESITAGAYSLTVGTGSYTLSGQSVGLKEAHKVAVGTGSYALTGKAINLLKGRTLAVGTGAYTLSGQAIILKRAKLLTVGVGSYTLSGQAIGLYKGRTLVVGVGSYALSGQAVALKDARRLVVGAGAYALSGQAVALKDGRLIAVGTGSYILTGQAANLLKGRTLAAGTGAYTLSGQPVGFRITHILVIGTGAYLLVGQAVSLKAARQLGIGTGSYILTGKPIAYTPNGRSIAVGTGIYLVTGQNVALRGKVAGNPPSHLIIRGSRSRFIARAPRRSY